MINTNVSYKNVMLDNTQTLHMQLENVPFCLKGRFFFHYSRNVKWFDFLQSIKAEIVGFRKLDIIGRCNSVTWIFVEETWPTK